MPRPSIHTPARNNPKSAFVLEASAKLLTASTRDCELLSLHFIREVSSHALPYCPRLITKWRTCPAISHDISFNSTSPSHHIRRQRTFAAQALPLSSKQVRLASFAPRTHRDKLQSDISAVITIITTTTLQSWALLERPLYSSPAFHKSSPLVPILSQTNAVHTITSHLYKIHLNTVHPSMFWSS
jgi:hypothetical protein